MVCPKQAEGAEKIIEEGRKDRAKKFGFKVDKQTGLKLKANVGSDARKQSIGAGTAPAEF